MLQAKKERKYKKEKNEKVNFVFRRKKIWKSMKLFCKRMRLNCWIQKKTNIEFYLSAFCCNINKTKYMYIDTMQRLYNFLQCRSTSNVQRKRESYIYKKCLSFNNIFFYEHIYGMTTTTECILLWYFCKLNGAAVTGFCVEYFKKNLNSSLLHSHS